MQYRFVATCLFGLEHLLGEEIDSLGYKRLETIDGRVIFEGDISAIARCNLWLRTAERVFVLLGRWRATSFTELFDGTYALPWEEWVGKDDAFPVKGHSVKSALFSIPDCQSIVKKAAVKRLSDKYKCKIAETGYNHKITISIRRDFVNVYLNTSGEPLHKRGYRTSVGDAPIKETVAACLLYLSIWNKSKILVDPFTGSGTIPIEAAMIAKNIAPGLNRDFDFLHFERFDTSFYQDMLKEAKANIVTPEKVSIFGYDIEKSQVTLAKAHAKKAGVSDAVEFSVQDMRRFSSEESYGVIVTNPPYGERLLKRNEIVSLYRDFGKMYNSLKDWSVFTITPVSDYERLFGKKADKKRKIFNGKLECAYYSTYGKPPKKSQ